MVDKLVHFLVVFYFVVFAVVEFSIINVLHFGDEGVRLCQLTAELESSTRLWRLGLSTWNFMANDIADSDKNGLFCCL